MFTVMTPLFVSLVLFPVCTWAQSSFLTPRVWYGSNSYNTVPTGETILPERHATFPIDHNNPGLGNFTNRYWVNDTFYELGGPVFVYDAGAGDAQDAVFLLTENGGQSAVMELARAFHGAGVVLEHRYYGRSVPFVQNITNGTLNASVEDLKPSQWAYHTLDQAVADLNTLPMLFELTVNETSFGNVAGQAGLLPSSTPYIVLGGGIGGVRAAVSRLIPSPNIFASWASSAPVQAQIQFPQYFEAVETAIPHKNCSTDTIGVRNLTDQILAGNTTDLSADDIKIFVLAAANGTFNTSDISNLPDLDVASSTSLLNIGRDLISGMSYFQVDGVPALTLFCEDFETKAQLAEPSANGLISQEGVGNATLNFLTSLSRFESEAITLNVATRSNRATPQRRQNDSADSDDSGDSTSDDGQDDGSDDSDSDGGDLDSDFALDPDQFEADDMAWHYQFCSQFGFFIASDPANNNSIQSQFISFDAIQNECTELFKSRNVSIPAQPQVSQVLQYGGWHMKPTQTFFTHGELDPWRAVSVGSTAAGSPLRQANKAVPAFNTTSTGTDYFGLILNNAVHAQDMVIFDGSSDDVKSAFNQSLHVFSSALQLWLESYHPVIEAAKAASIGSSNTASTASISSRVVAGVVTFFTLLLAL